MYHFFSAVGGAAADRRHDLVRALATSARARRSFVSLGSGDALSIDQLREVRPHEVEQAEDDRRDDRHDDHDDGRGADFLGRRPGDLLQLGRDLVGEACRYLSLRYSTMPVTTATTRGRSAMIVELVRRRRAKYPQTQSMRPLQQIEQQRPHRTGTSGGRACSVRSLAGPRRALLNRLCWLTGVAGETGLEPAALRFGDGCSTIELLP